MRIFVSYARRDRDAVDALLQDIRRARHDVWVDEELTGGQSWWDTILGTIRGADLFVVALSPDWLTSKACAAELHYAVACNRTVLPIMVRRVSPQMAPQVIADAQIVDYLERTPDTAIGLMTALATMPPAGPLPQPSPPHPPVPMSYMSTYRERVEELNLSFQQQSLLLSELRAHLADEDDRDSATELIVKLRRRGDITESIGKEIDALLASTTTTRSTEATTSTTSTTSTASATPAGWYTDPYRRYDQRYWDGAAWTEHVSRAGRQLVDAPHVDPVRAAPVATPAQAVAPAASSAGKWDAGTFIPLLIVSVIPCIGVVGLVVGAINLNKPGRRSQAVTLIVLALIVTLIVVIKAAIQTSSALDSGVRMQPWFS